MWQAFVKEAPSGKGNPQSLLVGERRIGGKRRRPQPSFQENNDNGRSTSTFYAGLISQNHDPMPDEEARYGPAPNPHPTPRGFFCKICGDQVASVSREKHNISTLHIFNEQHRPLDRKVQIDESNKGFRLLEGMGWKVDEGLGARKQGRVNPVQTTFKRDTQGLGAGTKLQARVTHFPSHIPSQALNAPDGKSDAVRAQEGLALYRKRRSKRRRSGSQEDDDRNAFSTSSGAVTGFFGGLGRGDGERRIGEGFGESSGIFQTRKERSVREGAEQKQLRQSRFELFSDVPEEYAALF